jgi:hypothetical protein
MVDSTRSLRSSPAPPPAPPRAHNMPCPAALAALVHEAPVVANETGNRTTGEIVSPGEPARCPYRSRTLARKLLAEEAIRSGRAARTSNLPRAPRVDPPLKVQTSREGLRSCVPVPGSPR